MLKSWMPMAARRCIHDLKLDLRHAFGGLNFILTELGAPSCGVMLYDPVSLSA